MTGKPRPISAKLARPSYELAFRERRRLSGDPALPIFRLTSISYQAISSWRLSDGEFISFARPLARLPKGGDPGAFGLMTLLDVARYVVARTRSSMQLD